jgi:hypothetical protein
VRDVAGHEGDFLLVPPIDRRSMRSQGEGLTSDAGSALGSLLVQGASWTHHQLGGGNDSYEESMMLSKDPQSPPLGLRALRWRAPPFRSCLLGRADWRGTHTRGFVHPCKGEPDSMMGHGDGGVKNGFQRRGWTSPPVGERRGSPVARVPSPSGAGVPIKTTFATQTTNL